MWSSKSRNSPDSASSRDELTKVVERQGDRVISAITAGPHDKIVDPVSARVLFWYNLTGG